MSLALRFRQGTLRAPNRLKARQVTDALLETCHDDCLDDGIVAVLPVQEFLSARACRDATLGMPEASAARLPPAG